LKWYEFIRQSPKQKAEPIDTALSLPCWSSFWITALSCRSLSLPLR